MRSIKRVTVLVPMVFSALVSAGEPEAWILSGQPGQPQTETKYQGEVRRIEGDQLEIVGKLLPLLYPGKIVGLKCRIRSRSPESLKIAPGDYVQLWSDHTICRDVKMITRADKRKSIKVQKGVKLSGQDRAMLERELGRLGHRLDLPKTKKPTHGPNYSREVARAQKILNQLGYPAGNIDGIHGKATRAAIRAFNRRHFMKYRLENSFNELFRDFETFRQASRNETATEYRDALAIFRISYDPEFIGEDKYLVAGAAHARVKPETVEKMRLATKKRVKELLSEQRGRSKFDVVLTSDQQVWISSLY